MLDFVIGTMALTTSTVLYSSSTFREVSRHPEILQSVSPGQPALGLAQNFTDRSVTTSETTGTALCTAPSCCSPSANTKSELGSLPFMLS